MIYNPHDQSWPVGHAMTSWTPRDSDRFEAKVTWSHVFPTSIGVRHGVSKGSEDGRRPPTLQASHPWNDHKAVSGIDCQQGVQGLGMAGRGKTLKSPPLAIRLWFHERRGFRERIEDKKMWWDGFIALDESLHVSASSLSYCLCHCSQRCTTVRRGFEAQRTRDDS
jgi:hypothetical protein